MDSRPTHADDRLPALSHVPRPPFWHGRDRRRDLAIGSFLVLAAALLTSLWRERLEFWTFALVVLAAATLLYSTGWWHTRRLVAATIVLDLAIVFLFLCSLGEREHVVIRVVNGQYI